MKCIIAGSRKIIDPSIVARAVKASEFQITEVVSGQAPGVDTLGEDWAKENKIPIEPFPAKWKTDEGYFDRSAGFKRNKKMAEYADALIAIWDGESKGTKNMIAWANRLGLKVFIYGENNE